MGTPNMAIMCKFNKSVTKLAWNRYIDMRSFSFGWKGDALQRAMDNRCLGDVCKSLETQSAENATACVKAATIDENIDGCELFFQLFVVHLKSETKLTRAQLIGLTELPGMESIKK